MPVCLRKLAGVKTGNMAESIVTNEDNILMMKRYPDGFFDLAIVDPPYGINATNMQMGSAPNRSKNDGFGSGPGISTAVKVKNRLQRLNGGGGKLKNRLLNTSTIDWDYEKPNQGYFDELFRVSKNQIIWGGNYFTLPPSRCMICWDKMQPWENFSQIELAWTSFDMPASIFKFSNTGGGNSEKKIHPTQKPVELYRWLLNKYAKNCKTILDTHLGSGSHRIAAFDMEYDFYATELNESYFNDQNKRFYKHSIQQKLFTSKELESKPITLF